MVKRFYYELLILQFLTNIITNAIYIKRKLCIDKMHLLMKKHNMRKFWLKLNN
jgi:hypothetical protein